VKISHPKKLNNVKFTEQCQVKISDRFVALERKWDILQQYLERI